MILTSILLPIFKLYLFHSPRFTIKGGVDHSHILVYQNTGILRMGNPSRVGYVKALFHTDPIDMVIYSNHYQHHQHHQHHQHRHYYYQHHQHLHYHQHHQNHFC